MYAIVFHAHQKLDRVARRHLGRLLAEGTVFPSSKQIVHFEGGRGPDNAKLKRQGQGEQPWHFVNPFDASDTDLHEQIRGHFKGLTRALKQRDDAKAAFQAAWLAHALVDGLTPPHHYPYEAELSQLRGGEGRNSRKGLAGRIYVKSNTVRESILLSLKLVGPKGLLTTHAMFEAGAWAIIEPLRLDNGRPSQADLDWVIHDGVVEVFKKMAQEVAELRLYDRFIAGGWTLRLNRDIRRELAPRMVRMITLAWYAASYQANSGGLRIKA
jgi:hypothetical protein